ncbi:VWFA-related domain-containing protein [Terriglobus saanensis SP1PR4]|uniref:VWFA-related domain-containing protein n=2 Tax=Terriglobus saanensis TaxID=870903 RepID=E8V345_TERSS|nr:VWFA-related domain-containing protein [Terriglobus saanensis SP1PR4]
MPMRRLIPVLSLALAFAPALTAQVVGQNQPTGSNGTYTMTVRSQLVIEAVTVKDKKGNPIPGLTTKDFTLTEDGVPQTIRFVEHQTLPSAADAKPIAPPSQENVKIYNKLALSQISTDKTGNVRYKDRRLLALYFDMSAMPPPDQLRSLAAAEKFVRTQMTDVDLVAILRYTGGAVNVLQDFTADRPRILSILQTMIVGEGQGMDESTSADSDAADTGAAFGQDDSEFNIFNTDRQLSALQTAVKTLGQLSEKKSLLYFASGLRLNGTNNQAQLHATIDASIRAGVSIWPIDARGLVAEAPLGDATQGSPGGASMYNGVAASAATTRFQQSQDTLYALAGDTGGKALFDNNDLSMGIVKAQQSVSSYYILGYYTTNPNLDGRFRRIKITMNPEIAADLEYRQGYFAGKEFAKFNAVDKERQLEDALMLGDPITELTIAMEINYFQLNRAEYFVPLVVKIPGRELSLAKQHGAEHTLIDFVGEIKDNYGDTTVTNLRDNVNIKLTDATAAELAKRPIEYDAGFTVLPGKYTIKFLARDDETGRIGTYQTTFVIPNLNKEEKHVPTSSVVLSSQRVDPKDALYNAAKGKDLAKESAVNPLVQNGQKLIPSVTRVFSRGRDLYVYLQAYEQASESAAPLVSFVTLLQGKTKVFESRPIEAPRAVDAHLQKIPLNFTLDLKTLPPGEYTCQVTVLDTASQKASFWQAPILLVP